MYYTPNMKGTAPREQAHPCRLIGKAQLLDDEGNVLREVPCNHHRVYYQAIFDAMGKATAKNNDYAGGQELHPMGNFLQTQDSGIAPRTGLWVRMTDKIGRIKTFFRSGTLAVKDEPVADAFADLGNYCFLMLALLADETGKPARASNAPIYNAKEQGRTPPLAARLFGQRRTRTAGACRLKTIRWRGQTYIVDYRQLNSEAHP